MSDYREFHPDEPSRIAVEAIEEREQKAHKDESIVTTSVGVVFKTKPVALGLLQDIQKKYNKLKPKPPVYFIESKGRAEPNPDDIGFQEAKSEWEVAFIMAQMDALLLLGTELLNVPKGVPIQTEDSWMDICEILDIEIPKSPKGRYLLWVKYVAAPATTDIQALSLAIGKKTGVSDAEVETAMDRFQR